ncbi:MAG: toll/interleukin-1 receptor domain-containing protein [Bacteroidales bacterium]|nr:toll/interleukin-1 receptor domain-containing protein [Bacteroidales bacterium]
MGGVFISYRHEGGYNEAELLATRLRNDGYKVFMDKTSLRGGKFDEIILKNIEQSKDFIVILDKNFFDRTLAGTPIENDWARMELAYAIKLGKNIIPVMLPEFEWPQQKLPVDIIEVKRENGVPYSSDYYDGFYKRLFEHMKTSQPFRRHIGKIVIGLVVLSIVGFAMHGLLRDKPKLILFGGGSVKGYIQNTFPGALNNTINMPMASTAAWSVVTEEISIGALTKESSRDYYLVLMSAEKFDANQIMNEESKEKFRSTIGYLAEIEIGESPLQVLYSEEFDSIFEQHKQHDSIDSEVLLQILLKTQSDTLTKTHVYTTTANTSATWRKYNSLFHSKLADSIKTERFHTGDDRFDHPYVILESSSYTAALINDTPRRIKVIDSSNNGLATCPLYVYFVVYKTSNSHDYFVPNTVRSFLAKIGIVNFPKNNNEGDIVPNAKDHELIRHFDQHTGCFDK